MSGTRWPLAIGPGFETTTRCSLLVFLLNNFQIVVKLRLIRWSAIDADGQRSVTMLRVLGGPKRFCDGLTRRELLQVGSLGLLGTWPAGMASHVAGQRRQND